MTPLAAYLLLFLAVGVGFILVHLVAGKLVRPSRANPEKGTVYECGEPTIGSAWVQFDLRFYVVALLFVIFDVEVAFFFPWAEVFGKANAIRAAAEPRSLAEHNAFAARVNDLASPHASVSGAPSAGGVGSAAQERQLWRKLEAMGPEEYEAYVELRGDLTRAMRYLGERGHEGLRSISERQLAAVQDQARKLVAVLDGIRERQRVAAGETLAAYQKLPQGDRKEIEKAELMPVGYAPAGSMPKLTQVLENQPGAVDRSLRSRPLRELRQLPRGEIEALPMSPPLAKAVEKALPDRVRAAGELSASQAKEVAAAAAATLEALAAAGEVPVEVWGRFTPQMLDGFAKLTPGQLGAFRALTPEGLTALETPLGRAARQRAESLAWLALVEILVFFGVLLVGFAYLWKRGDLAWVRSTAAEQRAEVARAKDDVGVAV